MEKMDIIYVVKIKKFDNWKGEHGIDNPQYSQILVSSIDKAVDAINEQYSLKEKFDKNSFGKVFHVGNNELTFYIKKTKIIM